LSVKKTALKVVVKKSLTNYPKTFHPPKFYPEFDDLQLHSETDATNHVYDSIREVFRLLEYDKKNLDTPQWNPLTSIIKSGDTVLIKPNLVKHTSSRKETTLEELITHPSIIVAVLDYVILALKNKGTIIFGDSPIQEADFKEIMNYLKITDLVKRYKTKTSIKFEITDFRKERAINRNFSTIQRIKLQGDKRGYSTIDLAEKSALFDITTQFRNFRVTNYDIKKMTGFHYENHHSYIITNSALNADVIFSLPKIKTHRKAGFTCALKNLIGINGSKDCLPHHRKGSIEEGGDEYIHKSLRKRILSRIDEKRAKSKSKIFCFFLHSFKGVIYLTEKIFRYKDPYKEGSWYGNQTIPRTIVDLFYIINFADKNGELTDTKKKRKTFTITDGIIGGEGDGPLRPVRKETGVLVASEDFIANDLIVSYIMGFNPSKIPTFSFSLKSKININDINSIDDIKILSNIQNLNSKEQLAATFPNCYEPTTGWKDHIER